MNKLGLAEAIRLGAMLRRQARGNLFYRYRGEIRSCALGGALEAAGLMAVVPALKTLTNDEIDATERYWPLLSKSVETCPASHYDLGACSSKHNDLELQKSNGWDDISLMGDYISLMGAIQHLNDSHRWTRERIAAWVETLEPTVDHSGASEAMPETVLV